MSGIYILETADGYRVTYSEDYYSLFGIFDDNTCKYKPIAKEFKETFGYCFPFTTETSAIQFAQKISKSISETDDGIMLIKDYKEYTFEELCNG
jgi:hypothetical protein